MNNKPGEFFQSKTVAFVGFSSNANSFSRKVYKDFIAAGYKVYLVNKNTFSFDGKKVYKTIDEVPSECKHVYVLLNKENTAEFVKGINSDRVKQILFQNNDTVGEDTLQLCKKKNIKAFVACPRMFLSKGIVHKLHGVVKGVF